MGNQQKQVDAFAGSIEFLDHGFAIFDDALRLVIANGRFKSLFLERLCRPGQPLQSLLESRASDDDIEKLVYDVSDTRARGDYGAVGSIDLTTSGPLPDRLDLFSTDGGKVTAIVRHTPANLMMDRDVRDLFGDAIDHVNFGVALIDDENRLVFANQKFREIGDPNNNLLIPGQRMRDIHAQAIRTGLFPIAEGMTSEQVLGYLDMVIDTNGQDFPVPNNHGSELVGNVYDTEHGGKVLTIQDVTQARQTERLLVNAMDHLPVGVAIEDASGQFTHCNDALAEPYGLDGAALLQMTGPERIAYLAPKLASINNQPVREDLGDAFRKAIVEQRQTLRPFEVNFKSGRHFLVERAETQNDGRVVVVTDITSLKDAETRNLAAVTDAVQSLDIGLVLIDKEFKQAFGNDKWREIFASEAVPPTTGEDVKDVLGRQIDAGMYLLPDTISRTNFVDYLGDVLTNYKKDIPLAFADGRFVLASCHRTRLDGYLISFVDITEKRKIERELERQRQITQQQEKLSALGELLAGVAHELNNPLSIIVGYAQMLEDELSDPNLLRRVGRISEAATRSAKIVQMFLSMAKQQPFETEPCSVNEIVDTALEVAQQDLDTRYRLNVEFADDLPVIKGDADQLIQVMYNLVINAQQAIREKGREGILSVRTYRSSSDREAVIEIANNGPGVPKKLRNRVFEPLFSTKEIGEGTGVGLAICHRIVSGHNGTIAVNDSKLGGARFVVRLPLPKEMLT